MTFDWPEVTCDKPEVLGTTSLPTTAHNEPITEHSTKATTSQLQTKSKPLENNSSEENEVDQKVEEVQESHNPENDSKNDSPEKQKLMVDEYHTVMVPDPIQGPVIFGIMWR